MANQTIHSIKITPYYLGEISNEDVKDIPPKGMVKVLSNSNRGKSSGVSYPIYLMPLDSVVVVYDGVVTAIYYRQNSKGNNPRAILYTSNRSIYNESNYTRRILSESKRQISNEYTFTFTEQDFLDAKNK